jgi:hypothetical protein
MLTTKREDTPEVVLVKNERTGNYAATVMLPSRPADGFPAEPLVLALVKGKANGEFGMTNPGRWYITSRLSGYTPTGPAGREGYPTRGAAVAAIAAWITQPDNGETWS